MSINPPLTSDLDPLRNSNEHFILQRDAVTFEIIIDGLGRLQGSGKCILTSSRLCLINTSGGALRAFDVPLALVFDEGY